MSPLKKDEMFKYLFLFQTKMDPITKSRLLRQIRTKIKTGEVERRFQVELEQILTEEGIEDANQFKFSDVLLVEGIYLHLGDLGSQKNVVAYIAMEDYLSQNPPGRVQLSETRPEGTQEADISCSSHYDRHGMEWIRSEGPPGHMGGTRFSGPDAFVEGTSSSRDNTGIYQHLEVMHKLGKDLFSDTE